MSDLSKTINGEDWGNPLSRGILANNTETKDMNSKELRQWLKEKGVIVRSRTADDNDEL